MSISQNERRLIENALAENARFGEVRGASEAIWIAAKNYGIEQAATLANDFDFGLDSQAGLVKDIRALKDSA